MVGSLYYEVSDKYGCSIFVSEQFTEMDEVVCSVKCYMRFHQVPGKIVIKKIIGNELVEICVLYYKEYYQIIGRKSN